jgi:hypothetical protein
LAAIAAVISVIALSAGAGIATRALESGTRPARASVPTQTSVLPTLTQERHYVLGILSLAPQEGQYVLVILSLTRAKSQATFGTSPTSPRRREPRSPETSRA